MLLHARCIHFSMCFKSKIWVTFQNVLERSTDLFGPVLMLNRQIPRPSRIYQPQRSARSVKIDMIFLGHVKIIITVRNDIG